MPGPLASRITVAAAAAAAFGLSCGSADGFGYLFHLEAPGVCTGYYSSVTMIGSETETVETSVSNTVYTVPDTLRWTDVILRRGVTGDTSAWAWRGLVEAGNITAAITNFTITALDDTFTPVARWSFVSGWPVSMALEHGEDGIARETLRLVHEGFVRASLTITNRPPVIYLPAPFYLPVGGATNFTVTTTDPDADFVALMKLMAPPGATFSNNVFSWTAPLGSIDTTNRVVFRADDLRGAPNSVVTNETAITVPRDFDADAMDDDWEIVWFGSLAAAAGTDADADGMSNLKEFLSSTQPTNPASYFHVTRVTPATSGRAEVRYPAEPGQEYRIEYRDGALDGAGNWQPFADPAVGVWLETNAVTTERRFLDDGTAATTGGLPTGPRYYRLQTRRP